MPLPHLHACQPHSKRVINASHVRMPRCPSGNAAPVRPALVTRLPALCRSASTRPCWPDSALWVRVHTGAGCKQAAANGQQACIGPAHSRRLPTRSIEMVCAYVHRHATRSVVRTTHTRSACLEQVCTTAHYVPEPVNDISCDKVHTCPSGARLSEKALGDGQWQPTPTGATIAPDSPRTQTGASDTP